MSKKNIIPAYSVFLLNNSNYQNYYQTYMREYIGQTLFDVICGAVNMPVAVQYVLSSIILQTSTSFANTIMSWHYLCFNRSYKVISTILKWVIHHVVYKTRVFWGSWILEASKFCIQNYFYIVIKLFYSLIAWQIPGRSNISTKAVYF